jgi:hypothetical protein
MNHLTPLSRLAAMPRRNATILTTNLNRQNSQNDPGGPQHNQGTFGGFPGPFQLARRFAKKAAPKTYRNIQRKLTMPYTTTIEAGNTPWLTVPVTVTVGRNSDIHVESLSDEVIEQIGGAEYKALRWLSYLVPIVSFASQYTFTRKHLISVLSAVFRLDPANILHHICTLAVHDSPV